MAAIGKLTVFFESKTYGWTENFNLPMTEPSSMLQKGKDYVAVRKNLLGVGAAITAIRVSQINPALRSAQVFYVLPPTGSSSIFTGKANTADDPSLSLLVRFNTAGGKRSMKHLSGIPDILFDRGLDRDFAFDNPIWKGAFSAYNDFMTGGNIGIAVKSGSDKVFDQFIAVQQVKPRRKNRGRAFALPVGRRMF